MNWTIRPQLGVLLTAAVVLTMLPAPAGAEPVLTSARATRATAPTAGGAFVPVPPTRILDTRSGVGAATGAVGPAGSVSLPVRGVGLVPAANVAAVVLNVTVTQPSASGYASMYDLDRGVQPVSSLNFAAGQTVANLVVAPIASNGKVALFNGSQGRTHFLADIQGYFTADDGKSPGSFKGINGGRVLDTRSGVGVSSGAVPPGATLKLNLNSYPGVEVNAAAVFLNVTVTQPAAAGYLSVFADGTPLPQVSNLNFTAGLTVPNLVMAPIGKDGSIDFYNGSTGTVHILADIQGEIRAGGGSTLGSSSAVAPTRLLDSRSGLGLRTATALASNATLTFTVAGAGGVVQASGAAAMLNVTVTQPSSGGYLSVYADGSAQPGVSNVNFSAGQTVPDLVMAPIGPDGKVTVYNGSRGTVYVLADVQGYAVNSVAPLWREPVAADPAKGGLSGLSCYSVTHCLAGDQWGSTTTYDQGTWTAPTDAGLSQSGISSISCVSATVCGAVGEYRSGDATPLVLNGSRWIRGPLSGVAVAVSCATSTFCLAVDEASDFSRFDGSVWSPWSKASPASSFSAVACPSASWCEAVDMTGASRTFNGANWSGPTVLDAGHQLRSIACPSSTFCVAIDEAGRAFTQHNLVWSAPVLIDAADTWVDPVSCASSTFCVAVDRLTGTVFTFNGSTWAAGVADPGGQPTAISCPAEGVCLVVDNQGAVTRLTNGSWSSPVSIDPALGPPTAVSCPVAGRCVAVDGSGGFLTLNGGVLSTPARISPLVNVLTSISCASATFCMAVTSNGYSTIYNGDHWSNPVHSVDATFSSVSCPATSFCVAVDYSGNAYRYDGTSWSSGQVVDSNQLTSVACASVNLCVASDLAVFNGSTWSAPRPLGDGFFGASAVSCPTTSRCLAVTSDGNYFSFDGASWTGPSPTGLSGYLGSLSCASVNSCVATVGEGTSTFDGSSWSTPVVVDPVQGWSLDGISCPTSTFCAVVSDGGDIAITRS